MYDHVCLHAIVSLSGVGSGFFGSGFSEAGFSCHVPWGVALWLCPLVRHVAILIRHERRDVDEDFDVALM